MRMPHLIAVVALAATAGCGSGTDVAPTAQPAGQPKAHVETPPAGAPATAETTTVQAEASPRPAASSPSAESAELARKIKAGEPLTAEDMDRLRQERAHLINRDSGLREEHDATKTAGTAKD